MTENRKTFSSDALWFMPFWQVGLMRAMALIFFAGADSGHRHSWTGRGRLGLANCMLGSRGPFVDSVWAEVLRF